MTCISGNYKYKNSFIILFSYLTLTRLEDIAFLSVLPSCVVSGLKS